MQKFMGPIIFSPNSILVFLHFFLYFLFCEWHMEYTVCNPMYFKTDLFPMSYQLENKVSKLLKFLFQSKLDIEDQKHFFTIYYTLFQSNKTVHTEYSKIDLLKLSQVKMPEIKKEVSQKISAQVNHDLSHHPINQQSHIAVLGKIGTPKAT